jgi:hypothetical protein
MTVRVIAGRVYGIGGVGWPYKRVEIEPPEAIREKALIKQIVGRSYGGVYAKKPIIGEAYEHFKIHHPEGVKLVNNTIVSSIGLVNSGMPKEYSKDPFVVVAKVMTHFGFESKDKLPPLPCLAFVAPTGYRIVDTRNTVFFFTLIIPEDLVGEVSEMVKKDPNFVLKVYRQTFPDLACQTKSKLGMKSAQVFTESGKKTVSYEPLAEFNSQA